MLSQLGCHLHEARTLAEARSRLTEQNFDLVLLDLRMPDGNGLELARELRATEAFAALPVIVVSASVLPSDKKAATEAGCNYFLSKPIFTAALIEAIDTVIGTDGSAG